MPCLLLWMAAPHLPLELHLRLRLFPPHCRAFPCGAPRDCGGSRDVLLLRSAELRHIQCWLPQRAPRLSLRTVESPAARNGDRKGILRPATQVRVLVWDHLGLRNEPEPWGLLTCEALKEVDAAENVNPNDKHGDPTATTYGAVRGTELKAKAS